MHTNVFSEWKNNSQIFSIRFFSSDSVKNINAFRSTNLKNSCVFFHIYRFSMFLCVIFFFRTIEQNNLFDYFLKFNVLSSVIFFSFRLFLIHVVFYDDVSSQLFFFFIKTSIFIFLVTITLTFIFSSISLSSLIISVLIIIKIVIPIWKYLMLAFSLIFLLLISFF